MKLIQFCENAENDYLTMRCLYYHYFFIFNKKIAYLAAQCLEKIMKAYLIDKKILKGEDEELKKYKHSRLKDIRKMCSDSDGKWDERLRYNIPTNSQMVTIDPTTIVIMVDKIFLESLQKISDGRMTTATDIAKIYFDIIGDLEGLINSKITTRGEILATKKFIEKDNAFIDNFLKIERKKLAQAKISKNEQTDKLTNYFYPRTHSG